MSWEQLLRMVLERDEYLLMFGTWSPIEGSDIRIPQPGVAGDGGKQNQTAKEETTTLIPESEIRNCPQSLSAGSIACREGKTPEQVCSERSYYIRMWTTCTTNRATTTNSRPWGKNPTTRRSRYVHPDSGKITRNVGEISAEIVDEDNNNEEVEEEVLEEERVDNVEEEQTELPAEEDDVSEIIQKLTPILDSAKEQGFTVNELEIEKKRKSNKHYSMK